MGIDSGDRGDSHKGRYVTRPWRLESLPRGWWLSEEVRRKMEGTSDVDVLALLLRAARTWPTQLEALCGYELSSGRIGAALRSGILGLEKEGAKMTQTVHDELRA